MDSENSDQGKNNGSIYLVESESAFGEMERAIAISVMGVAADGGSIFSPLSGMKKARKGGELDDLQTFKQSWQEWQQHSFREFLAETFVEVYTASAEMRVRRIMNLDKKLDSRLSGAEVKRSREAGRCFLEGKSEMRRAPQWQKYARAVEQGDCPGHVVTVFALQSALYHLPLLPALTAYVYFEWRAGMGVFLSHRDQDKQEQQEKQELTLQCFQQQYPESMDVVREFFDGGTEFGKAVSAR
ncbi:MAG: hypothetical protein QM496_13110 [Verrucomicrobiota bacterium]